MTDVTAQLAAFAIGPAKLDEEQRSEVLGMLDRCVAAARSVPADSAERLQEVVSRISGGPGEAAVWSSGRRLQAEWAAFLNAFLLRCSGESSPAAVIVPAAAAVSEVAGSSEEELAEAVIIGLEIADRMGEALGRRHQDRGWDLLGTAGVVASSAVAARLLGLDAYQTSQTLGLGGTQIAGLMVQDGTDAMALHTAKAAFNGVEVARLVQQGLDGPLRILEGRRGIFTLASDDPQPERVISPRASRPNDAEQA